MTNSDRLLQLALETFPDLKPAEQKLFEQVGKGEATDYTVESDDKDANDPAKASQWDDDRVIDAGRIAWLCTDPEASNLVTHRGIVIVGARIDGLLDLAFMRSHYPVTFRRCAMTRLFLHNAEISSLSLNGTHAASIRADGLSVARSVFLRGCVLEGEVRFLGATIGGNLECDGSQFRNPGDKALSADNCNVAQNVFLRSGCEVTGEVRFLGATIGGNLECDGIKVQGEMSLAGARIGGVFFWLNVVEPNNCKLDLREAQVGAWSDEAASWPEEKDLLLHGFIYGAIGRPAPRDAASRLEWLRLQAEDERSAQPYQQLANVLRAGGETQDAAKVLIGMEQDRPTFPTFKKLPKARQAWERVRISVLGFVIGNGYRPQRAWRLGAIFLMLGVLLFGIGSDSFSPTSIDPPGFNALIYSIDSFVPLIDFHQERYWLPDANAGRWFLMVGEFGLRPGAVLRWYHWLHIAVGWLVSFCIVAGLTGIVRKN